MPFLFIFGNTPQLSSLELTSVLTSEKITNSTLVENDRGRVSELGDFDPDSLFARLGGTVKLAKIIGSVEKVEDLENLSLNDVFIEKKINLGLSVYGPGISSAEIKIVCDYYKHKLRSEGHTVRYVLPTESTVLTPVVVQKQHVAELVLFYDETTSQYYLANTLEVSDFTGWNHRDYDRPRVDPHVGMMPPRVARMMVNLAIADCRLQTADFTLLDPFCGVGTILAEGLMVGASIVGSDLNRKQVEATRENLEWIEKEYGVQNIKFKVYEADARHISSKLGETKIDAIVTEPDLGPNTDIAGNVSSITGRLESLYVDSLKDWQNILKPGGKVVIALPSFFHENDDEARSLVTHVVDKAKVMGYSLEAGPVLYRRPQARVGRNITVFRIRS